MKTATETPTIFCTTDQLALAERTAARFNREGIAVVVRAVPAGVSRAYPFAHYHVERAN